MSAAELTALACYLEQANAVAELLAGHLDGREQTAICGLDAITTLLDQAQQIIRRAEAQR